MIRKQGQTDRTGICTGSRKVTNEDQVPQGLTHFHPGETNKAGVHIVPRHTITVSC